MENFATYDQSTILYAEWGTLYQYTADLLCMEFCHVPRQQVQSVLSTVHTPLDPVTWEAALGDHPDRVFVRFLLRGMTEGFRIGFRHTTPLWSAPRNMLSALHHPEVVHAYLLKECALGRMLGPFPASTIAHIQPLHINRFGVIPKGHNTGKWRLITDLSYPPDYSVNPLGAIGVSLNKHKLMYNILAPSIIAIYKFLCTYGGSVHIYVNCAQRVNDGIDPEWCSLSYTSVEQVATVAASYPLGALMAKIDVESAYRLVPVHPQDKLLRLQSLLAEWGDRKVCGRRRILDLDPKPRMQGGPIWVVLSQAHAGSTARRTCAPNTSSPNPP